MGIERERRPWRQQLKCIRELPEWVREDETMTSLHYDVGAETAAYAAYLNAPRHALDSDQQQLLEQDMVKARAAMERAWLEAKPVREAT